MFDSLRDPIWTFVGVVIAVITLGIAIMALPIFNKEKVTKDGVVKSYEPDTPLGIGGYLLLLLLLISCSYLAYIVVLRIFIINTNINELLLYIFVLVVILFLTIGLVYVKYNKVALILLFHFVLSSIFTIILISVLEIGAFVYEDFTFIKTYLEQQLSTGNIPINLSSVPVDLQITNLDQARSIFFVTYGTTFVFLFALYLFHREQKRRLASQVASQTIPVVSPNRHLGRSSVNQPKQPKIKLSEQERELNLKLLQREEEEMKLNIQLKQREDQEKQLNMQLMRREDQEKQLNMQLKQREDQEKRLDIEKKHITYALEIASKMTDTLLPDIDVAMRTAMITKVLPDLLQLGDQSGSDITQRFIKIIENDMTNKASANPVERQTRRIPRKKPLKSTSIIEEPEVIEDGMPNKVSAGPAERQVRRIPRKKPSKSISIIEEPEVKDEGLGPVS